MKVETVKSTHPAYVRWVNMIARCYKEKHPAYQYYGKRGISVCDRWRKSVFNYVADTGVAPFKGAQLDRIDNDGNYEPSNMQWVTSSRNNRNRRSTKFITFNGETMCLADWADKLGLKRKSLMSRINMGWPIEQVLNPQRRNRWDFKKQDIQ